MGRRKIKMKIITILATFTGALKSWQYLKECNNCLRMKNNDALKRRNVVQFTLKVTCLLKQMLDTFDNKLGRLPVYNKIMLWCIKLKLRMHNTTKFKKYDLENRSFIEGNIFIYVLKSSKSVTRSRLACFNQVKLAYLVMYNLNSNKSWQRDLAKWEMCWSETQARRALPR